MEVRTPPLNAPRTKRKQTTAEQVSMYIKKIGGTVFIFR